MERANAQHGLTRKRAIFAVLICGIVVCFIIAVVSIIRAGSVIPDTQACEPTRTG